jgi:hypothetical protein
MRLPPEDPIFLVVTLNDDDYFIAKGFNVLKGPRAQAQANIQIKAGKNRAHHYLSYHNGVSPRSIIVDSLSHLRLRYIILKNKSTVCFTPLKPRVPIWYCCFISTRVRVFLYEQFDKST